MRNYVVYFEMFGRNMKTTVLAKHQTDAREKVLAKLNFHKIELKQGDDFNKSMELLDDINKIFKK